MLRLAYGRSGQRVTCPHCDAAVPSSAVNITILDESGGEVLASTAATKGSLSSTLAVAASRGDRTITVGSASGCSPGDPIVLEDASGRTELATVDGAETSGNTITLRDGLARDYAVTTTTVKSALVYYNADLSTVADWPIGLAYQALFSCADWTSVRAVLFRIVDLQALSPITFEAVRKWIPNVSEVRDSWDDPTLAGPRERAWKLIELLLRADERDPAVWRDSDECELVGGILAAAIFLLDHNRPDRAHELAGEPVGSGGMFRLYWGALGKTPGWFDHDQDRSRDQAESLPVESTTVRRGL